MSLYDKSEPSEIHRFRANTGRQASMPNVNIIHKRKKCVSCLTLRTEATGQETEAGFVCGMCGGGK